MGGWLAYEVSSWRFANSSILCTFVLLLQLVFFNLHISVLLKLLIVLL